MSTSGSPVRVAPVVVASRTQYEVLRLFADGKSEIEIADFTTLGQRSVTRLINDMCAGDRDTARQLATAYERRASMVAAAQGKPGVPGLPRTTQVPPLTGTLRPPAVAPAPPTIARATDVLADLLAAASASPHQRTRSLGAKLTALAEDLRTRLTDERRAAEAAEAAVRAKAEAQRRIDQLSAELAKAREQFRVAGGTATTRKDEGKADNPGGDVPAKVVRAWARENGVDVPALGRIPRDVMDGYRTATSQEGSSPWPPS
ncbi:histone-like nucleoid-structuring protein Lsr2 [Micromonospora sp. NPDC047548]|uniref:Lsr2 family DNA-binding protein n=1 Tax=Micromonospora sp. NPDC047548 TaxID=3155624 RepID=UPI0033EA6823